MEPIATVALKVGASFAALISNSQLKRLENTALGEQLSKVGVVKPSFAKRLETQIVKASELFLKNNASYNIDSVHQFLYDNEFLRQIETSIFDGTVPDKKKVSEVLESYVGIPLSKAPGGWPGGIEPSKLIDAFFAALAQVLGRESDAPTIFLAQKLANIAAQLDGVKPALDSSLREHSKIKRNQAYEDFERGYLEHLNRKFSRVSTPGAKELHGIGQVLSLAYISLNVLSQNSDVPVPAEQFLKEHDMLIVRGPAGSGKTTLLSWLVTQCGKRETKFGGLVPFFIPLRSVARLEAGPPSVDSFVGYSVDSSLWTTAVPAGWLEEVLLRRRNGLIMIDGVDELPSSRRAQFWEWLNEFTEAFSGNKVIVTSRNLPRTTSSEFDIKTEEWNPPPNYVEARLQEMSDQDVTSFINHWHDAVDFSRLMPDDQMSLRKAKTELPNKLEDPANRRIRELCSTPLLCAMVCVLHWREEGYLPKHRVDLYDKCCEMLIEARDLKREIAPPVGPLASMTKYDKEMVLQRLAFDMLQNRPDGDDDTDHTNYRIEISRNKAEAWIAPRILSFQAVEARSAKPEAVLDFLVERTGLLREPSKDLIDFPHRTFQEYLAACAAGAEAKEDLLARLADDDQWHETIMLASGTATGGVGFGRRLIEALIARGERHVSLKPRSQRIRKTCFALALGCLENLRQHAPELRERVLSNLDELVPPLTDSDAAILAVAGDAAVPHLSHSRWKDSSTPIVAACARALRLIGTTTAARALSEGYISDVRADVIAEVARTGQFTFDQLDAVKEHVATTGSLPPYVREVSDLLLVAGLPNLQALAVDSNTKGLELMASFGELKSLVVRGADVDDKWASIVPPSLTDLTLSQVTGPYSWISPLERLETLVLLNSRLGSPAELPPLERLRLLRLLGTGVSSLDGIEKFKIESFDLRSSSIDSISQLSDLPSLENLELEACSELQHWDASIVLEGVKSLRLDNTPVNIDESVHLPALENLTISDVHDFFDLSFVKNSPNIRNLNIFGGMILLDLAPINTMSNLKSISFGNFTAIDMPDFSNLKSLEEVSLVGMEDVRPEMLSKIYGLKTLEISLRSGRDFSWISGLTKLESLTILGAAELKSLSGIGALNLKSLWLQDAMRLQDLSELRGLKLEELRLMSCPSVSTLSDLASIESLERIYIAHLGDGVDLQPLADLPNLKNVYIYGPDKSFRVPESIMPKLRRSEYFYEWQMHHAFTPRVHRYSTRVRTFRTPKLAKLPSKK